MSKMNVSLSDLALSIPAKKHMNLLDKRYHTYTPEELIQSATSGSLYRKRDKVVIRKIPPIDEFVKLEDNPEINNTTITIERPLRSTVQVEEVFYEELEILDPEEREAAEKQAQNAFADEFADMTDKDEK